MNAEEKARDFSEDLPIDFDGDVKAEEKFIQNLAYLLQQSDAEGYRRGVEESAKIPGEVWLHGHSHTAQMFCDEIVSEIRALSRKL